MKLLKLFFVLAFCFAALGQRNIGFQIDSIGFSKQSGMAPYLKVSLSNSIYIVALESIYEIYQDPSTNQWMKDFATETPLSSLQWNETVSLLNGTFTLLGAPCPCNNSQQGNEGVEPFNVSRRGRQQSRDALDNINCQVPPFDFLQLEMLHNANGQSSCQSVDISQCNNNCTQACQSNPNPDNCSRGCGAITNSTIVDTNDCNTTCTQSGTTDADCHFACINMATCIAGNTCRLDLRYLLSNYQWSNASSGGSSGGSGGSSNSSRKLAFSFQILNQPVGGQDCGTELVTWLQGPFFLWINTTTFAMNLPNVMDLDSVDISSAVVVPTNVSFAPGGSSVTGRFYVDAFTSGYSLFNYPRINSNSINGTSGNNQSQT